MIKKIALLILITVLATGVKMDAQNNVFIQNNTTADVTFALSVNPNNFNTLAVGNGSNYSMDSYSQCQIYIPTYNSSGEVVNSVTATINSGLRYQIYWDANNQRFDIKPL